MILEIKMKLLHVDSFLVLGYGPSLIGLPVMEWLGILKIACEVVGG